MKIHWIIFVLGIFLLSFSHSDGAKQKNVASGEEQVLNSNEVSEKEAVKEDANPPPHKSVKKENKQKDTPKGPVERKARKEKVDSNDTSAEDLKEMLSKMNKTDIFENEPNDTKPPYETRHYLTPEQKYYLLRMNLLGIGIYVVHDIIPIPISSTDQYTKAMGQVLDRVEATRPAAANATKHGMHNITLEDADRLHKAMSPKKDATMTSTKAKGYTTEILIFAGVIAAVLLLGVLIWACKKGQESSKRPESYYDPLQPGSGLAMN